MPDRTLVHRRTAVAGTLAVAALAGLGGLTGCDTGDDIGQEPTGPSTGPSTDAPATAATEERTPDQQLVDATIEGLVAAFGVLVTARSFPGLRPTLVPFVRAHRRHVEVLEGDLQGWVAPTLADQATALVAVRRSETALHASLVAAASRAESGALAKLLASISASTTQLLATLPRTEAR